MNVTNFGHMTFDGRRHLTSIHWQPQNLLFNSMAKFKQMDPKSVSQSIKIAVKHTGQNGLVYITLNLLEKQLHEDITTSGQGKKMHNKVCLAKVTWIADFFLLLVGTNFCEFGFQTLPLETTRGC